MLDYRIQTFLTLCETMSFTKTAEKLNITQPAVTQQIKYLEDLYRCKLFAYQGRTLSKTTKGEKLERYAKSMFYSEKIIKENLMSEDDEVFLLKIGATKTIGEYVIGKKICSFLSDEKRNLSLVVDNTTKLLKLLDDSQIDLAVIEGFFDKSSYDYKLMRNEPFVGICAKDHPFAISKNKNIPLQDLFSQSVILREQGSGTRDIFEQVLHEHSYSVNHFKKVIEINNFSVIKELVSQKKGISFVYEAVAKGEKDICTFNITDLPLIREFNYVFLKNTQKNTAFNTFMQS